MAEQIEIFTFREMKPRAKVPISRERIEEAKKLFQQGNVKGSIDALREVRYKLEAYCNRITTKP